MNGHPLPSDDDRASDGVTDEPADERVSDAASIEEEIEETARDVRAEAQLLERAIGGWRGIIDSGLPTVVFVVAYAIGQQQLVPALIAALVAGVLVAIWRVVRRESVQQVLSGFLGVGIAAFFAWRTGKAEDYFLPGLLINLAYGSAFLLSILVRWPLVGIAMGFFTGDGSAWRKDDQLRRVYGAASWIWVAVFYGRLAVQLPLYLGGSVGALGILRIVMGWPLFLAGAYLTYRLLAPIYTERRAQHDAP